ncbi:hypothetical protein BD410DRAFT_155389 [Rickenella mellea]|uniref:Secreted protein n=1 Tax=Rickenella mellea TaxID=50990 RepID=A0A4Y7PHG4_9AGAM|nr:hypothetical protein BD410DRAFT_155389 [Rickenella mellea]
MGKSRNSVEGRITDCSYHHRLYLILLLFIQLRSCPAHSIPRVRYRSIRNHGPRLTSSADRVQTEYTREHGNASPLGETLLLRLSVQRRLFTQYP